MVGIKGVGTPSPCGPPVSGVQPWGEGCGPRPRQEPGREDEASLTRVTNEQGGSKVLPDCPHAPHRIVGKQSLQLWCPPPTCPCPAPDGDPPSAPSWVPLTEGEPADDGDTGSLRAFVTRAFQGPAGGTGWRGDHLALLLPELQGAQGQDTGQWDTGQGSVRLHGAVLVPPRGEQGPGATAGQSEPCHGGGNGDTAGQVGTDTPDSVGT